MRKLFFVLILSLFSTGTFAQTKIAYIDILKIRQNFKDYKEAEKQYQAEMSNIQAKLQSMQQEIDSLRKELETQAMLLSEEKKKEKQNLIQQKITNYQQFLQEQQNKAVQRENELLAPIQEKLKIAIEKIARKEGFDFVLDVSNTYYANEAWDITNEVLRTLNTLSTTPGKKTTSGKKGTK